MCTERDRRDESGKDGENPDRVEAAEVREAVQRMPAVRGGAGADCPASENGEEEKSFVSCNCIL